MQPPTEFYLVGADEYPEGMKKVKTIHFVRKYQHLRGQACGSFYATTLATDDPSLVTCKTCLKTVSWMNSIREKSK